MRGWVDGCGRVSGWVGSWAGRLVLVACGWSLQRPHSSQGHLRVTRHQGAPHGRHGSACSHCSAERSQLSSPPSSHACPRPSPFRIPLTSPLPLSPTPSSETRFFKVSPSQNIPSSAPVPFLKSPECCVIPSLFLDLLSFSSPSVGLRFPFPLSPFVSLPFYFAFVSLPLPLLSRPPPSPLSPPACVLPSCRARKTTSRMKRSGRLCR